MKNVTPEVANQPSQGIRIQFGLNLFILDEHTVKSPLELFKPVENHTNLELRFKPGGNPVSFDSVDKALNLSKMTQLKSLKLEKIYINNEDHESSLKLEGLIRSCTDLRTVCLSRVFTRPNSHEAALRVFSTLSTCVEELEFHNNNLENWNDKNWTQFDNVMYSLKRFSFQSEDVISNKNMICLGSGLNKAKKLVSCEIKINNISNADMNSLINNLLPSKSQLRILELGTFDLSKPEHIEILEKILKTFPSLISLGLKVERWNNEIADTVFNLVGKHGQHLSQLIIQSNDVVYNIEKMDKSLTQTKLLDVRFINLERVDRTPDDLIKLSIRRTNDVSKAILEKTITHDEFILKLEALNEGSVSYLPHQIINILNNYLALIKHDNSKIEKLNQFLAKLSCVIDEGKIPFEFIVYIFSQDIYPDYVTLPLYPAVLRACQSSEEIETNLKPHFMSVVGQKLQLFPKMTAIREKFIGMESSQIEKSLEEIKYVEALLVEPVYFPLLKPIERYGYLLAVNSLKDEFSTHLKRPRDHVVKFVKTNSQEFVGTTDLNQFYIFMICNLPVLARLADVDEGRGMKLFHFLLSKIKSTDFVFETSKIITHLKCHTPSIPEQIFFLKLSLACQRVAIFRGFQDKEKHFEVSFKEFQRTMSKNSTECLSEIDRLVEKLFDEKVSEHIPAFLKVQIDAERAAVPKKVPLKDLLRPKTDDQDSGKRVPLKDLLRPKSTDEAPLGKFFDDQRRDKDPDAQDAGLKGELN